MLSPSQTIATSQRNISQHCWAQHVARVWPLCCVVLRHVGCCWLKFEDGQFLDCIITYVLVVNPFRKQLAFEILTSLNSPIWMNQKMMFLVRNFPNSNNNCSVSLIVIFGALKNVYMILTIKTIYFKRRNCK